jgi:hypothetical protein
LSDEFSELCGALQEGTIEDAQIARLDQILAEHPEAVERFVDLAILRADLSRRLAGRPEVILPRRSRRLSIGVAAAAILGLGALVWGSLSPRSDDAGAGRSFEGYAVLAQAVDPVWEGEAPAAGSVLARGRLRLASGWVQIEFFSGVRMVLEGPAELELLSKNEASCRYGKLRAFVPPPAEGFAIRAGSVKLVDRGTEFGLRQEREGDSEIHVFQGKVELHRGTTAPQNVAGGEALRIDPAGGARPIPADTRAFISPSDVAARSTLEARGRYARWRETSRRLKEDPRVALYYSFEDEEPWAPELRSHRAQRSGLDGAIVGCRWAEGRWPQKKALEFKGPGDRVRFRDAGSYESLTLAAWVRIDGLDRPFSGLMLTDGWTSGSVHWQITQRGVLRLGIHGDRSATFDYDSPVLFETDQLGRWTHLCTVYDHDARSVTHYQDGKGIRALALRFDTPLRLGSAELGNWGAPIPGSTATYAVRNLNGRMDEFALFGRALNEREVRELFAAGAP